MHASDVRILTRLGRSVWMNTEDWERSTLEVMTAVSLLGISQDQSAERAGRLLLERARESELDPGVAHERDLWMSPFYRLPVDQRFVLAGLHGARWSYSRLGRILGCSVEDVEKLAWNARIHLNIPSLFPTVLGKVGASCPEFDPLRPWTQRFLDDEIASKRDQLFLQNHLMACASCQRTLDQSRVTYYEAEKRVPLGSEADSFGESLKQVLLQNPNRKRNLLEEFLR